MSHIQCFTNTWSHIYTLHRDDNFYSLAVARWFSIHIPIIVKVLHSWTVWCKVLGISRRDVGRDELCHTTVSVKVSLEPEEDWSQMESVRSLVQRKPCQEQQWQERNWDLSLYEFNTDTEPKRSTEFRNLKAPGPSAARAQGFLVAPKTIVNVAIAAWEMHLKVIGKYFLEWGVYTMADPYYNDLGTSREVLEHSSLDWLSIDWFPKDDKW